MRSVASFFVSRVDTLVDKRLDALEAQAGDLGDERAGFYEALKGKAAVANAKEAYRLFSTDLLGTPLGGAPAQGANVQRPLWASTSTKNPAYRDVMYVEELIGADTVNTMPLNTIEAFRDHGRPAGAGDRRCRGGRRPPAGAGGGRRAHGGGHGATGAEGVRAFAESYEALLAALDEKRRTHTGAPAC